MLQGSKIDAVVTYGDAKRVWCQCIRQKEVDVNEKNETLWGNFNGGDNYEGKKVNIVEDESSSSKTQGHNLVKLFENRLTLKEDAKMVISNKLTPGVLFRRVGERS